MRPSASLPAFISLSYQPWDMKKMRIYIGDYSTRHFLLPPCCHSWLLELMFSRVLQLLLCLLADWGSNKKDDQVLVGFYYASYDIHGRRAHLVLNIPGKETHFS